MTASTPLAIDRVERSRAKDDHVRLRLSGRWLSVAPEVPEALLVVQAHGRRHRFAADRDDDAPAGPVAPHPAFSASFTIPDWAVPEQPGQAVLWVGEVVVPVPPPGSTPAVGLTTPAPVLEPIDAPWTPDPGADGEPPAEPARSGPLADLLVKETISALHSELEQRSVELARLRGELAQVRSDVQARGDTRSGLEAAHTTLRTELERLTAAVGRQRTEFERRAATLRDERDRAAAALTEAETARDRLSEQLDAARGEAEQELDRHRAETEAMLGAARAQADARAAEAEARATALGERLAAVGAADQRRAHEAAALREQLAGAQIARVAAASEAEGLRAELQHLGSELAVTREHGAGVDTELSEAERLLADARALTERLRGEAAG